MLAKNKNNYNKGKNKSTIMIPIIFSINNKLLKKFIKAYLVMQVQLLSLISVLLLI